jgi:tetratricopeptide (TPR) repeat protein
VNKTLRHAAAALTLCCVGQAAQAQLIEDADLRVEGADAVLQIRMVSPIQFQRSVGAPRGDIAQVFYDVIPAREVPSLIAAERRLAGEGKLPDIVVSDDGVARANLSRKLTIRFGEALRFQVRSGRGNRSIELVLEGLGPAIRAASLIQPLPSADANRRYVVTVQSSNDPSVPLAAPIPASVQDYEVFSSRRSVDGKRVFDINVGFFATLPEAERARELLRRRFALAVVVALPAPVAVARAAPAPPPGHGAAVVPLPAAPAGSTPTTGAPAAPSTAAEPAAVGSAPATPASAAPAVTAPSSVVPAPAPSAAAAAPAAAPVLNPDQVDAMAAGLLGKAQTEVDRGDHAASIETLNQLLNLPPNASSRRAQELIGQARMRSGDTVRARSELELFLKLYPQGTDSDRVRQTLAQMPQTVQPARPRPIVQPTTTLGGSIAQYYYGGKSKTRTQEFLDSPISGLPELISDQTVSDTDQSQSQTNVDLTWRHRDAERDTRFVFRDSYTYDLLNHDRNRNRLSALYVDHKSFVNGTSIRAGRQSPIGGGVLYRFDGAQAGYNFAPKWKVNGVFGVPSEKLLDAKRRFYGASIDAEALTNEISGSIYAIEQIIDGEVDRRALGTELRYFSGGLSASAQLDYDVALKDLNIGAFQGTWQFPDNTVINALYDYRAVSTLTLGNLLFFPASTCVPPAIPPATTPPLPTRISDLLAQCTVQVLRAQAKGITAFQQQALLGLTTPLSKQWQWGADIRLTNIGEVKPVPSIGFAGSSSTGKLWSLGTQVIGSNLYSNRDSHVLNFSFLSGPTYRARLWSYNNLSVIDPGWQFEPSMRYYSQSDTNGVRNRRITPGLRLTFRPVPEVALESELSYEQAKTETPGSLPAAGVVSANRIFYFVGVRYDF